MFTLDQSQTLSAFLTEKVKQRQVQKNLAIVSVIHRAISATGDPDIELVPDGNKVAFGISGFTFILLCEDGAIKLTSRHLRGGASVDFSEVMSEDDVFVKVDQAVEVLADSCR